MKIKSEILFGVIFAITVSMLAFKVIKRNSIMVNNSTEYISEIENRLESLMDVYGCDKAAVYLFSKRDDKKIGPIKYEVLNCYAEINNKGITPQCYMHQNIPTLLLSNMFKNVDGVKHRKIYVGDIEKYKDKNKSSIKFLMNILNTKSLYSIFITNHDGEIVGIVSMNFINDIKVLENLNEFERVSNNIEYFLNKDAR